MAAIGYVTRDGNAFKVGLKTLTIRADIQITPNARRSGDTQPDYRVTASDIISGRFALIREEWRVHARTMATAFWSNN